MNRFLAVMLSLLQGCATCQQHPVACRAAVVVVVSGVIYGVSTHHTMRQNQCANIGLQC